MRGNWQCNQCYQGSGYPYYLYLFDMLRRKLQPMHRMQFWLYSLSQHRSQAHQSLPQRFLWRYLNEYLPTLLQQWIGALLHLYDLTCSAGGGSSNCDSCNPGTFLYLSHHLGSSQLFAVLNESGVLKGAVIDVSKRTVAIPTVVPG